MNNHQYKRLNQRFDARLNRIRKMYDNFKVSNLYVLDAFENLQVRGSEFHFFSSNNIFSENRLTSYEVMHMSKNAFRSAIQ